MKALKILVIEDETSLIRVLEPTLAATGATVRIAQSGAKGLEHLGAAAFDIVLCDLGLPDIDGEDLIKAIRRDTDVPIIVLSARGAEDDRIKALDAGADDFVPKPFSAGELLARIRAADRRRRPPKSQSESVKLSGIEVDLTRRRVVLDGQEIRLSGREHSLLTLLAQSAGGVVTHREIIERVWGPDTKADTQFVRVLVGQLRQKLEEDPSRPQILRTEPGLGYRLRAD
jgi:two-component system KDP operon response regulator KdpE